MTIDRKNKRNLNENKSINVNLLLLKLLINSKKHYVRKFKVKRGEGEKNYCQLINGRNNDSNDCQWLFVAVDDYKWMQQQYLSRVDWLGWFSKLLIIV